MSVTLATLIQRPVITSRSLDRWTEADVLSRYRGRRLYEYNTIAVLELRDLPVILPHESDWQETIPSGERYRPDLTSRRFYVAAGLWWVILRANGFMDPFIEYTAGRTIRIPRRDRVLTTVLNA